MMSLRILFICSGAPPGSAHCLFLPLFSGIALERAQGPIWDAEDGSLVLPAYLL